MKKKILKFGQIFGGCMGNAHAEQPKLVSSGTVVGPGVVAPDQWGLAQTSVVNPTMSDQTLLTTVTFTKDARMGNVQFAREFWIPAGGRPSTLPA